MNDVPAEALQAQPMPPGMHDTKPGDFPWREIQDYISLTISATLAQQNVMVGQQMIDAGAPDVDEKQLDAVKAQAQKLSQMAHNVGLEIGKRIKVFEGKGPRLIVPR